MFMKAGYLPWVPGRVTGGWGYTHDRRAYKDSYPHDWNVTDDLCSLNFDLHLLWLIFRLNVFYC